MFKVKSSINKFYNNMGFWNNSRRVVCYHILDFQSSGHFLADKFVPAAKFAINTAVS